MEPRLPYWTIAPEGVRAMLALYGYFPKTGLDKTLIDWVFLRVSQINGCAYCVDYHSRDLLKAGEPERRITNLITWRENAFFSPRERAALAWAEALTRITETHAPDADYDAAHEQFSDKDLVDLTLAISLMNALNRVAIGFRRGPAE